MSVLVYWCQLPSLISKVMKNSLNMLLYVDKVKIQYVAFCRSRAQKVKAKSNLRQLLDFYLFHIHVAECWIANAAVRLVHWSFAATVPRNINTISRSTQGGERSRSVIQEQF